MRYLKQFNKFNEGLFSNIFSKHDTKKSWKDKFDDLYKRFKSKNCPFISSDIEDNYFSVSIEKTHLVFYKNGYEVVDFEECDIKPNSTKGRYEIDKQTYDEYLKKAIEISDFLDKESEENLNKSTTTIGPDGWVNLSEYGIRIEEINQILRDNIFKKYIGKEFEFEMSYHLWTSGSSNEHKVERYLLPIKDIRINIGGGRCFIYILVTDSFGDNYNMWIEEDTTTEYIDLEENKWPYHNIKDAGKNLIRMHKVRKEMSRVDKRNADKNQKYPYTFSYDATPCRYNSIEFIKEIVELLKELNDQLRKKYRN